MASGSTYLTTDGLRELEGELAQLRSVRRHEAAARIQELETMIHNAVIIPDHRRRRGAKSAVVEVGSIVKVQAVASKRSDTYTIVGSAEAAPDEGRISNESPLGRALLGKKAGDVVEFTVPAGNQKIKVISVR